MCAIYVDLVSAFEGCVSNYLRILLRHNYMGPLEGNGTGGFCMGETVVATDGVPLILAGRAKAVEWTKCMMTGQRRRCLRADPISIYSLAVQLPRLASDRSIDRNRAWLYCNCPPRLRC